MTTKLLAVDDSKTMRKVLDITFGGDEFETTIADSAQDALSKLAASPRVALVDVTLGDANGYDLCQQIKSKSPGVSVLILSSKQQPYDRARGNSVGADDFMDKPFDTQQLIEKVKALAAATPALAPAAKGPPASVARPQAPAMPSAPPRPAGVVPSPNRTVQQARVPSHSPTYPGTAPHANRPIPLTTPRASTPAKSASVQPGDATATPLATGGPVGAVASAVEKEKRGTALAERSAAGGAQPADMSEKLRALGLTPVQVDGVLALSREVVEQVVWEVVPALAETMIQEELKRLTSE